MPAEVVETNVASFDLETCFISRGIGEAAPFEALDQHRRNSASHLDVGEIWLGNRSASGIERVGEELVLDILAALIDHATSVHEIPERAGNIVACDVVIEG